MIVQFSGEFRIISMSSIGGTCRSPSKYETLTDRIRNHQDSLADLFIEPNFGLLDKLLAIGVLTRNEYEDVRNLPISSASKRNRQLLRSILAKDKSTHARFLTALDDKDQKHVANFLRKKPGLSMANQFGDIRPLDNSMRSRLDTNCVYLIENIDRHSELLDHCLGVGCISREQSEFVMGNGTKNEKNRRLLDILCRWSVASYKKFLECLSDCKQAHVAEPLRENAAVATIRADFAGDYEEEIVDEAHQALLANSLCQKLTDVLHSLGQQVKLLWCERQHSIDSYFACASLTGLQHLRKLFESGELRIVLEKFYGLLVGQEVCIVKLDWTDEGCYERSVMFFKTVSGDCSQLLKPLPGYIELTTTEPCCVTFDDDPRTKRARMPCGHTIGSEGVAGLYTYVSDSAGFSFACPSCSAPWDFFLVRHLLSSMMGPDELQDVEQSLNKNFMRHADIRQCPSCHSYCSRDMSACTEAGNKFRVVCLICEKNGDGSGDAVKKAAFCWLCLGKWLTPETDHSGCGNPNCDPYRWKLAMLATCETMEDPCRHDCPVIRACPGCGSLQYNRTFAKNVTCSECDCQFCFDCLRRNTVRDVWMCTPFNRDVNAAEKFGGCFVVPRQTSLTVQIM